MCVCVRVRACVCMFQHRSMDSAQVSYDDFCAVSHLSLAVLVVYLVKLLVYVLSICMSVVLHSFCCVNKALLSISLAIL